MQYTGLLALVAAVAGAAIPENAFSENPSSVLTKRGDYYDCAGSSECWAESTMRASCDTAIAGLDRNRIYTAGA